MKKTLSLTAAALAVAMLGGCATNPLMGTGTPQASAHSLASPPCVGPLGTPQGVALNRGAGAGCVTPSTTMKLARAM